MEGGGGFLPIPGQYWKRERAQRGAMEKGAGRSYGERGLKGFFVLWESFFLKKGEVGLLGKGNPRK